MNLIKIAVQSSTHKTSYPYCFGTELVYFCQRKYNIPIDVLRIYYIAIKDGENK